MKKKDVLKALRAVATEETLRPMEETDMIVLVPFPCPTALGFIFRDDELVALHVDYMGETENDGTLVPCETAHRLFFED